MVKSYNLDEYLECIIDVAFVALATMFAFGPHVFQFFQFSVYQLASPQGRRGLGTRLHLVPHVFFSSEILLAVRLWL